MGRSSAREAAAGADGRRRRPNPGEPRRLRRLRSPKSRATSRPVAQGRQEPEAARQVRAERSGSRSSRSPIPDPITSDRFDVRVVVEIGPDYHIYGLEERRDGHRDVVRVPEVRDHAITLVSRTATSGPIRLRSTAGRSSRTTSTSRAASRSRFRCAPRSRLGLPPTPVRSPFTFRLAAEYQTCTMEHCLLPAEAEFELAATASLGRGLERRCGGSPSSGAQRGRVRGARGRRGLDRADDARARSRARRSSRSVRRRGRQAARPRTRRPRIDLGQGQNLSSTGRRPRRPRADGSVTLRLPLEGRG